MSNTTTTWGPMTTVDVDEAADHLYALPPEEFTAERDAVAKRADPADAKAIKALRKPTVPAHVVNRVVRARPDDLDSLLALGNQLREAMTAGGDVRGLTERRRRAVSDLVRAAGDASGRDLTAAVEQDVAATLEAATADPTLGDAVRSGRLVKPLRYAGFGALPDLDDAVATPVPPTARMAGHAAPAGKSPKAGRATRASSSERRPRRATGARPGSDGARADTAKPGPDLTELRAQVLELAGIADNAQRRYEDGQRAVSRAREHLQAAERERAEAHRAAIDAHKAAEKARRELGRLERS